ncbi:MAG: hypothetical protein KDA36_04545, partial [Planctomycetaceae bacterium]|nr:hypothetical protein [Planctomycetaceae bacterium]
MLSIHMRRLRLHIPPVLMIAIAYLTPVSAYANDPREEFFEQKVRPLLVERCFKCHGDKKQFGELRVDSREMLLKGGENGPAIVSEKPDESLLIEAVRQSGDLVMPPEPEEKLSDDQISVLERWVAEGAFW